MPSYTTALDCCPAVSLNVIGSLFQTSERVRTSSAAACGLPPLRRLAWTRPSTTVTANVPEVSISVDAQTSAPVSRSSASMCPPVLMNTQPPDTIGGGD